MGPIKPYSLPTSAPQNWEIEEREQQLVRGQRHLNLAALACFLWFVRYLVGFIVAYASIEDDRLGILASAISICLLIGYGVSVAVGIAGLLRVESGLRMHPVFRIVLIPAIVVPLINIFTVMFVNSLASDALRAVGYRINFLGVAKRSSMN